MAGGGCGLCGSSWGNDGGGSTGAVEEAPVVGCCARATPIHDRVLTSAAAPSNVAVFSLGAVRSPGAVLSLGAVFSLGAVRSLGAVLSPGAVFSLSAASILDAVPKRVAPLVNWAGLLRAVVLAKAIPIRCIR